MPDLINLLTNNGDISLFNFLILCLSSFVTSTITASFGLGGADRTSYVLCKNLMEHYTKQNFLLDIKDSVLSHAPVHSNLGKHLII